MACADAATSSPNSAKRSTTCSSGWRHRSRRSGTSSPTPPTSCGPRSPPGGRCSRSRSPTPIPPLETLRATCEELVELGDQQERLITALLALASSQRGIGQLECLDLADIAEDVLLSRQEEAERHGIDLRAALAAAPVTGDPNLTESLVANLLDNAIRHNLPGGQAEISTALTTAGAVVSVSNTGTLVPPDAVQDLFQPFRQLGTQRTRHGEGHGLGLAIVRAIADAHGAALTARARPARRPRHRSDLPPDIRCPAGQCPGRDSAAHEGAVHPARRPCPVGQHPRPPPRETTGPPGADIAASASSAPTTSRP